MQADKIDCRRIPYYHSVPRKFKKNMPTRKPTSRDKTVKVPLWRALAIAEAYYKANPELLRGCR